MVKIVYMDMNSIDAPELIVETKDGTRWTLSHYDGNWGLIGWYATTYVYGNKVRSRHGSGLLDLINALFLGNIDCVPFFGERETK